MKKLNTRPRYKIGELRRFTPHPHRNAEPRRTWSRSKYQPDGLNRRDKGKVQQATRFTFATNVG